MIPRFEPYLSGRDVGSALVSRPRSPVAFEDAFARAVGCRHAVSFSYGRAALWAFLKTVGVEGAEVVMPAYTCSVVAHAVVLSGNVPRFADIRLED